ncbi:MAG: SUMF1/EgtB/PvdO family nonheme iron enzyme [Planctomycetes bacterium]|nr:SUMF1/EgtB/PvdO family nonheme iron enzyme [Planctomycetota bacterium]MBL7044747.1 SUMF1/EgtB/PvdO family nonheme iron enzyme [Pirellulaceae bacterium]
MDHRQIDAHPRRAQWPIAPTVVLAISCLFGSSVRGQTDKTESAEASPQTYFLTCTSQRSDIEVKVVDRAEIDPKIYVDTTGLRLWVDNDTSLKNVRGKIANAAVARHLVTNLLDKSLRESGVQPDTIPVRGEEGKKLGTDGMALITGGELTRTGDFYDSTGGGLTRLPNGGFQQSHGQKYKVRIAAFHIDKFKVTNEDFCKFLNDGNQGYATPWNPRIARSALYPNAGKFAPADRSLAKHPVVLVNWYQAKGFAVWAGKRLPTEAEWEFAASGTEGRTYPWGNEPPDETRADFPVKYKHTVPVDWFSQSATPEGVFQMVGNSAEWCADYFDPGYYAKAPAEGLLINPQGPAQGFFPDSWYKFRVVFKGWCKTGEAEYLTCTKRHGRGPFEDASAGVSFRCVKSRCT